MQQLDSTILVAGQIDPADVAALSGRGVTLIVNNRPDDEEPSQPPAAEIEAAAKAAGIGYRHIPVAGGFSQEQVSAMSEALASTSGTVLAFCRSGTRSTFLWALARSQAGHPADELMLKAATAGYDLRPIAAYLSS